MLNTKKMEGIPSQFRHWNERISISRKKKFEFEIFLSYLKCFITAKFNSNDVFKLKRYCCSVNSLITGYSRQQTYPVNL